MKIKGVHKDKVKYGEVIELSAEEKVPLSLQDGLANHPDFKDKYAVWTSEFKLESVNFFSKGDPLKKMWQNNHYSASGSVKIHRRRLSPDTLLTPKEYKFSIEFEDCLDGIGQPDTKVTKLTLKV